MRSDLAPRYIADAFEPTDRLAIVLSDKRTGAVKQRIAEAERIAAPQFQGWLRHENAQRQEVYISMNALRSDARSRTKQDVETVRHVYLDFDTEGTLALARLMNRDDLPKPNHQISSSPGKWQAVWNVAGFTIAEAEQLQRAMARELGADLAATDCTRVLRLPGFFNHKYETPHLVTVTTNNLQRYTREDFPAVKGFEPTTDRIRQVRRDTSMPMSQSERDWAYAKRALIRGTGPEEVIRSIASRRTDKPNPQYYADLTVRKAISAIENRNRTREEFSPSR